MNREETLGRLRRRAIVWILLASWAGAALAFLDDGDTPPRKPAVTPVKPTKQRNPNAAEPATPPRPEPRPEPSTDNDLLGAWILQRGAHGMKMMLNISREGAKLKCQIAASNQGGDNAEESCDITRRGNRLTLFSHVVRSSSRNWIPDNLTLMLSGNGEMTGRLNIETEVAFLRDDVQEAREQKARQQTRQDNARILRAGQVFKDCSNCPDMVVIPAGSFTMGSIDNDSQKPLHQVSVRAFAIGRTEVTQGQWRAVMGDNPSRFSNCGDNCPVEQVSWHDIQTFLQKLNGMTGNTYRLPSEAEWEYACQAGRQQAYCGSDNVDAVAWYSSNSGNQTHPVGQKQANDWGLVDMSGNVWEWTNDCWNGNYNGAPTDGSAWTGGDCSRRVLRGGSWNGNPLNVRSAIRSWFTLDLRINFYGFRIARTLTP